MKKVLKIDCGNNPRIQSDSSMTCKSVIDKKKLRVLLCCLSVILIVSMLFPMLIVNAEEAYVPESTNATQVTQASEETDTTQDTPAVQTVEVGIPVEERPELFLPRSMPTHGEGKIAVFLIDFPDYKNDNSDATVEYYERLYFNGGVKSSDNWSDISVADFYKTQSYGKLNLSGQVFDWYTAKNERSYYDNRKAELIMEAAEYYMSQGVDFSNFDGDSDGVIDAVAFHFSGDVQGVDEPWYDGMCMFWGGTIRDMKFTTIVQVADYSKYRSSISIVCHELMHTLGMPDLYSNVSHDFGLRDLMGYEYRAINPYTKILLGWVDEIQVITGNVDNVRLNLYGHQSVGEIAIVTDEFNGLWDEFYVVAFTVFDLLDEANAAIWHIDARLTEDQTAFRYQNQIYTPRPDKNNGHFDENSILSPYPFIEELFRNDSALGPDSAPSSDTHDGEYTGLKIDNFQKHNDEYLTFDVSIVDDTSAPIVITEEKELVIREIIDVFFNERIYKSENWDQISITDLDGNPIDASIVLPNSPNNEIEITFKTDAYKNGYKIMLPEDCLRDSSGNRTEGFSLIAKNENYIFPIGEVQLPNPGYIRNNASARFFPHEDALVIITELLGQDYGEKFEFMRLDDEGNVLSQVIVDNPFEINIRLWGIVETYDNCYIFVCANSVIQTILGGDLLFCIDPYGNLKWVNDDYYDSGFMFGPSNDYVKYPNGIWASVHKGNHGLLERAFIDSENGDIQIVGYRSINNFSLPNNQELCLREVYINGKLHKYLEIIDSETNESVSKGALEESHEQYIVLMQVHANNDGTIMIDRYKGSSTNREVCLLDASLNIIKTCQLTDEPNKTLCWFNGDGFCEIDRVESAMHDDSEYHIRRFDRYLNLIWEADVDANFIYYFKSTTGDLWAYKSMLVPERECYVEYYSSEDAYKTEHVHNIAYKEEVPNSCFESGRKACWQCLDCGCIYADSEGQTLITNAGVLIIPSLGGHNYVTDEYVAPTCTQTGLTGGFHCSGCGDVLVEQTLIDALGHYEVIDYASEPNCTTNGLTEGKRCLRCNEILVAQETIAALGHTSADAVEENRFEPTCTEVGGYDMVVYCVACGDELSREHTVIDALDHDMGEWYVALEPTCTAQGTNQRDCSRCDYAETEAIAMLEHVYEAVITAPTCTEKGYTTHTCVCGDAYVDSEVDVLAHTPSDWIVDTEPQIGAQGSRHKECTDCGETLETETIEALTEAPTTETPETEAPETDAPETEASESNEVTTDTESEKQSEGSCAGSLSLTLLGMMLILAAAVVLKKKEH